MLFSCNVFKLTEMGGNGQPCFTNNKCTGSLICIENICQNNESNDETASADDETKNDSDQRNDQNQIDEISITDDDYDQLSDEDVIDNKCNFGEICWKVVSTQQKRCFNETGSISCPDSASLFYGQDGNYSQTENRSFENKKIGEKYFVFDNITKFLWNKTSTDNAVSFDDAISFCNTLNNSGEGEKFNWRLPYLQELVSIVNFDETTDPMVDGFYFPFVKSQKYWTFTKLGYENYYYVDFSGSNQFYTDDSDSAMNYAICVSSEYNYDSERKFNRFSKIEFNEDTIIEDKLTGLQWQKVTDYSAKIWKDALLYCESLNFADKYDWRLPNINELHSLATYEKEPELQTTFPDLGDDFYWTSTTNTNKIENAWVIEFKYGILKPELPKNKNENAIYTMCVRNRD